MRRLVPAALVAVALLACPAARAHTTHAPFAAQIGIEETGVVNGRFGVGMSLRDTSGRPFVVTGVHVIEPARPVEHQIGDSLLRWHKSPPCPPGAMCPYAAGFQLRPVTAAKPLPLDMRPGEKLGVQLDFQLACRNFLSGSRATASRFVVAFHAPNGPLERRSLPLGEESQQLRQGATCEPGPQSHFDVQGRWPTETAWTVAGSTGDTCSLAGGRVVFQSRIYQTPGSPEERVEMRLAHLRGVGKYTRGVIWVDARLHGQWQRFERHTDTVTVTKDRPWKLVGEIYGPNVDGSPLGGTWRCRVVRG